MRIRKSRIADRVFLLEFESLYELAATFLRFQEHYESRHFRGKVFTLEDYMDWYVQEFGSFTYFEDWEGFNIPSSALTPFREGRFDPLLRKERQLLDLFTAEEGDFYIIGSTLQRESSAKATLRHEVAHALFTTDDLYRTEALRILRGHDTKGIRRKLLDHGYARQVLTDEVQAHLIADAGLIDGRARRRLAPLRRRLGILFTRRWSALRRPSSPL